MWFYLVATVVVGTIIARLFLSKKNKFWEKHGVLEIDTSSAISIVDKILGRKSMAVVDDYAYDKMGTTTKYCGIIDIGSPILVVKDLEMVKKLLIKDSDYFIDRRKFFHKSDGIIAQTLISLEGDEWKGVRASVSPTFTTGKIRRMMEVFNSVGLEWVAEFTKKAAKSPSGSLNLEIINAVNQYTVDVIGSAVFGMHTGTIQNPEGEFMKVVNRLGTITTIQKMKFMIRLMFPSLIPIFGLRTLDAEAVKYFERILEDGLRLRKSGAVKRNDFMQLLVEAQKGEVKAVGSDELSDFEKDAQISGNYKRSQYLTDDILTAQSIIFFFGGFSTTSNFISFTMYVLSVHQDVQKRLRQEIGLIMKEDGSLDYDDVGALVYLDMVLNEVHRKYPAAQRLERLCVRDYKDPETGLFVPKGAFVAVPVNSIHHDKRYYDNPDAFDPEHFSAAKKKGRSPYAFLPFGLGVRNCIGMRFAVIESKVAIAHVVHNFLIEPTEKTPIPVRCEFAGFTSTPPKTLELKLTPIKK